MIAIELALGDAIERVSRLYERHPEPRPDVNDADWTSLELEIQDAISSGKQSKALAAVARWERHAEEVLR